MKILVIRLSSIGDIILTTPILKELKNKHPDIIIDFLVMDKFKDAILGCPYVDNVIIFNKSKDDGLKNIIKFAKNLKINSYDYVFDIHSKLRSKIITKVIGGKSFTYKKRSVIKSILVKCRFIKYKVDDTIVKNYAKAFKIFNLSNIKEDLVFSFSKEDEKNIEKILENDFKNDNEKFAVIAPGASKETKKWTKEGFSNLINLIYEEYNLKTIIIGSQSEYEMCEIINQASKTKSINLAGKLSLKESGALLSKAEFLVTNDTGPFHIARGVKCKTFVIFGPTSPEMFEYDENNKLIYIHESCSPCSLHGDKRCPKKHFNCMENIKAKDIIKKINENYGG